MVGDVVPSSVFVQESLLIRSYPTYFRHLLAHDQMGLCSLFAAVAQPFVKKARRRQSDVDVGGDG